MLIKRHQDRIRDRERQREPRKASYPVYIKDFLKFSKKKKDRKHNGKMNKIKQQTLQEKSTQCLKNKKK